MSKKQDKIKEALSVLDKETGGEASVWFEMQQYEGLKHIVDYRTGRWVPSFQGASGTWYRVLTPDQGIGLKRYTELMKRMPAIGFDNSFGKLAEYANGALSAANTVGTKEQKLSDLFMCLTNISEGIRRTDRNWQMAFIVATLFIVRKDEDLSKWSFEDAQEKIEDWNKSNIHEQDFFFLVMFWRALAAKWYEFLPNSIKAAVTAWTPVWNPRS